ncbi:hypothetical protein ACHWQZ_G019256 [Mnemiopsis leidyi]
MVYLVIFQIQAQQRTSNCANSILPYCLAEVCPRRTLQFTRCNTIGRSYRQVYHNKATLEPAIHRTEDNNPPSKLPVPAPT